MSEIPTPVALPPAAATISPQPAPKKTVYVSFSAEVNPSTTESLLAVMANCVTQGTDIVYLLLSTPGGQVMSGLTIYNTLRGLPFELITHNVGNVDSIGNAIFLAGSKRYACPHSTFMFHGVGFDITNHVRMEEKHLRERLQNILSDQKRIGDIITERTRIKPADVESLFRDAQTKDATYAVGSGIVDEVKDIQIPVGASIVSLVFKR